MNDEKLNALLEHMNAIVIQLRAANLIEFAKALDSAGSLSDAIEYWVKVRELMD